MIQRAIDVTGTAKRPDVLDQMDKMLNSRNFAYEMSPDDLNSLGQRVIDEYKIDKDSRSEWEEMNRFAIDLATQVIEKKSEPFDGAANIKFPTLSMAAVQFAARAYPQLLQGANIVKGKVVGDDPEGKKASRADRVGAHMNYQILEQMPNWEDETDGLLVALPIEGCEFKKTYYNAQERVNISEWCRPTEVVINYNCKNFDKVPRITHIIKLTPNEITERVRAGVFLELDEFQHAPKVDAEEDTHDIRDEDAPHTFYEQHRFWDLDGDGYKEPIIATVHRDSQKVVRVLPRFDMDGIWVNMATGQVQRIKPVNYFTRFLFMPSPDGGVYGMGFGKLLGPINTSINMTLNQIHDAGTLANTQGGFIGRSFAGGRGRQGGELEFAMGEFKQVNYAGDDIRKSIMPLPFKGPDQTLFAVLGLLVDAGEKLGSVTDPIMGEASGANTPATTTLALIEQGSKVFSAVFKRLHRAFKYEFRKLYRLNKLFLDAVEYVTVLDELEAVSRIDYATEDCDIIPVSDPNMVSDAQQMIKAEVLKGFLGAGLNDDEIMRRALEAMRIPDIDKLIPKEPKQPEPDPKVIIELQKLELERDKLMMEEYKLGFEIAKIQADTIQSLAKAEALDMKPQVDMYMKQLELMQKQAEAKLKAKEKPSAAKSGGVS
jgi:chaperonin GroES